MHDVASALLLLMAAVCEVHALSIGIISYWGTNTTLYNLLPANQNVVALMNPSSGIFDGQTTTLVSDLASYQAIVTAQKVRGVNMIGYVPTGYGNHSCNIEGVCQTKARIQAQVQAYFTQMPDLAGIFFDEAAFTSESMYAAEYAMLRGFVNAIRNNTLIVFNAGYATMAGAQAMASNNGEALVIHEDTYASFLVNYADITTAASYCSSSGKASWVLIHTLSGIGPLNDSMSKTAAASVTYYYGTDIGGNWQAGDPTWNELPSFWSSEISMLQSYAPQDTVVQTTSPSSSPTKSVGKGAYALSFQVLQMIVLIAILWPLQH